MLSHFWPESKMPFEWRFVSRLKLALNLCWLGVYLRSNFWYLLYRVCRNLFDSECSRCKLNHSMRVAISWLVNYVAKPLTILSHFRPESNMPFKWHFVSRLKLAQIVCWVGVYLRSNDRYLLYIVCRHLFYSKGSGCKQGHSMRFAISCYGRLCCQTSDNVEPLSVRKQNDI